jgi:hypothetical protein
MVGLAPLRTESSAGRKPIGAWMVTGNFFHALGVRPALGRVLDVSDDTPGGAPMAVVSWRYWQAQFNGEERALGAIVEITDRRLPGPVHATVVGVAQPEFSGMTASMRRTSGCLGAIPSDAIARGGADGAVKPGLRSRRRARCACSTSRDRRLAARSAVAHGDRREAARAGLSTPLTDQFGGPLSLLMAIVGILLLPRAPTSRACCWRAGRRQHEMAVRVSLGAGRSAWCGGATDRCSWPRSAAPWAWSAHDSAPPF